MKIAELSEASGVSVATLKFYLREGLLHPGAARAVNQAEYDDSHVRRVRLIRALADLGNLGLADIGRVLEAVDDESMSLHDAFAVAQDAMVPRRDRSGPAHQRAIEEVDAFVRRHRLHLRPGAEVRWMLADGLVAMRTSVSELDLSVLDEWVPGALADAASDIAFVPPDDRTAQMEATVIGTVAVEVMMAALRRIALEHASWQRFGRSTGNRRTSRRRPRATPTP